MPETGQAMRKPVDVNEILNNSRLYRQAVADGMSTFTFYDRNMGTHITIATDLTATDPRLGTREGLLDYVLANAGDESKVRVFRPSRDYAYDAREFNAIAWDAQPDYMFERIVRSVSQEELDRARRPGTLSIADLRPDQMDAFRQKLSDYLGQAPARAPETMIGMSWIEYEGGMSLSTRMAEGGPVLTFSCGEPYYSIEIQFRDATVARDFVERLSAQRMGTEGDVQQQAQWDLGFLRDLLNQIPAGNILSANYTLLAMNFDRTKDELIDEIDRFLRYRIR
ncbi:MAG: hypothetical protein AB1657_01790 [Candidatus Micrarchaeota archaeon]